MALVGCKRVGKGVAVFCQLDPEAFNADEKTYFRYTRWCATRAVAQLLVNVGASFELDSRISHPVRPGSVNPDEAWQIAANGARSGPQATETRPGSKPNPELKPEHEMPAGY